MTLRWVHRVARIAFAFVLMNYAAAAGPVSLWRRRPTWR